MTKLAVDTELPHGRDTIAQAAMGQAVECQITAFCLHVGYRLELVFDTKILFKPRRFHSPGRKAGHTDKLHNVFRLGVGQGGFKGGCCIAFLGDGKGGAKLHGSIAK